jgi:hypothetical protein
MPDAGPAEERLKQIRLKQTLKNIERSLDFLNPTL